MGAPRGAGAAGARRRTARMATCSLLPQRLRATQRVAHQSPQARRIRKRQNSHDLAREAVGLHARVGPSVACDVLLFDHFGLTKAKLFVFFEQQPI